MDSLDFSRKDLLDYLQECDTIDLAHMKTEILRKERKKYIDTHPYSIYQGKDGKWYTTLPDQTKGRKKFKRNSKKEIEDIVVEYWKDQEENPTLDELFHEWNDLRLERNKIGKSSHSRYGQAYRRHFKEFGQKKIKNVSPEEIQDFLESELARCELSSKAFSMLKTITIGILKRAKRRKVANFSITDLLENLDVSEHDFKKTVKEDYQEVFNEEETEKMMRYCMNSMDMQSMAILLLFVTGIRVGELVALKHEDIKYNRISIKRTETKYENPDGKGFIYEVKDFPKTKAGVREIVVPKDYWFLLSWIRLINPFGEYAFTDENGKRITTNVIRRRMERMCRELNIYRKSPHKVRKTVNTIYMDCNLDNNLIKNQMGWSNIAVGENHYHRNRKSLEKKIDIISSIPEFQIGE